MIPRYTPQGTMNQAANGNYVASSDYDRLDEVKKTLLDLAVTYFHRIETDELAAADAETALRATAVLYLGL